MRILIDTYATAFQNKAGGVHNRIVRTVEALRSVGLTVDYFDKYNTNVADYDILHVFMLNIESYGLIKLAKAMGKKIVVSSIVTLSGKFRLSFYWHIRKLPFMTTYKILFRIGELADCIIAETPREARFIHQYYHVASDKIRIIPNGADEIKSDSRKIYELLGKECEYALEVGRFDQNKNQLNVIKALKNTDVDVVFIGGESPSEKDYYKKCLATAGNAPNLHFLGWVDSQDELLKSAYGNAKLLISSSFYETFGLTIVEGVMAGLVPVVSKTLPILDFEVFRGCLTFDPKSVKDIESKVRLAMKTKADAELKAKAQKVFSWQGVAARHIELYGSL